MQDPKVIFLCIYVTLVLRSISFLIYVIFLRETICSVKNHIRKNPNYLFFFVSLFHLKFNILFKWKHMLNSNLKTKKKKKKRRVIWIRSIHTYAGLWKVDEHFQWVIIIIKTFTFCLSCFWSTIYFSLFQFDIHPVRKNILNLEEKTTIVYLLKFKYFIYWNLTFFFSQLPSVWY